MNKYASEEQFHQFILGSQRQKVTQITENNSEDTTEIAFDRQAEPLNREVPDAQKIERIKQSIIKKVEGMTIDQINFDLLKHNKLALSAEEKHYRQQQQKLLLIKKGARIEKQEYLNFKDLKRLRQEQRKQEALENAMLRADGMIGITKSGKSYALQTKVTYSDRDLVVKKVSPKLTEYMKRFSDRRGQQWDGDGNSADVWIKNGVANVKQIAKKIGAQSQGRQDRRK